MSSPILIVAVSTTYLALLFAVAYYVDRQPERGFRLINSSLVYTLSLAVYCTSWTFYGSVGRASENGIDFLTIYLGPTLAFCLGWGLLRKILRVAKANRITSIADLIASRYGKSAGLAGLVTVIALIGTVPYIALQLKAVSTSFTMLASYPSLNGAIRDTPVLADAALWAALLLTVFAMLFGSRSINPGEHHQGMVAAVALDSLVKLACLTAVGVFVTFVLFNGFGDLFRKAAAVPDVHRLFVYGSVTQNFDWIAFTALSLTAVVCLPRQFQVMVVENVDERHLDRSLWLFPMYLLAINIFVLPIALGGRLTMPAGANPDSLVLSLPLASGSPGLALAAFIGGLSASAGMIVVGAAALSIMVCNDLVMPALLRIPRLGLAARPDLTRLLLWIRRAAMVLLMVLGYLYMRYIGEEYALVAIGLISFAAMAQFFPAMVLGLFWRRANRIGAIVGISAGFLVWFYTLFLPSFARSGWIPMDFIEHGPWGIGLLKPYALFGLNGLGSVAHSVFWSMLVNVGALAGLSLSTRQSMLERAQAALFVDVFHSADAAQLWRRSAQLPDLLTLVGRFLGRRQAEKAFADFAAERGLDPVAVHADAELVLYAERLLTGVIGAASARVLVSSVVQEEPLGINEVMRILDETSRVIEYNRRLEENSRQLEAAGAELRRANERLQELDRLKDDFVSTVNHELRTPLTSIRSFSEILLDNPDLEPSQRQEFQRIIIRETERLTRLINQMLDLAKIQSGQIGYEIADVDLQGVIRDAAAATGQLFRSKGVALEIPNGPSESIVRGDRDLLVQVLLNLLSNAVKFCPADTGRVRVTLDEQRDWLLLKVADNGPGIPPEHREAIFDRFHQVSDALTGKPPGTGLGLTICRVMLRQLGGEIWADADQGGGALLVVRLRAGGKTNALARSRQPDTAPATGR